MKSPSPTNQIGLVVGIWPGEPGDVTATVHGRVFVPMTANDPADNEENAVRLAEQMVREAFRRHREKTK